MASRIGEKVPGWVERMLIPTLESRTRSIVKEELANYEKVVDARFQAMDEKFETKFEAMDEKFETKFEAVEERLDSRFDRLDAKIDSLEKRFPVVQDLAEIKARLAQVEKNQR